MPGIHLGLAVGKPAEKPSSFFKERCGRAPVLDGSSCVKYWNLATPHAELKIPTSLHHELIITLRGTKGKINGEKQKQMQTQGGGRSMGCVISCFRLLVFSKFFWSSAHTTSKKHEKKCTPVTSPKTGVGSTCLQRVPSIRVESCGPWFVSCPMNTPLVGYREMSPCRGSN